MPWVMAVAVGGQNKFERRRRRDGGGGFCYVNQLAGGITLMITIMVMMMVQSGNSSHAGWAVTRGGANTLVAAQIAL